MYRICKAPIINNNFRYFLYFQNSSEQYQIFSDYAVAACSNRVSLRNAWVNYVVSVNVEYICTTDYN